MKNIENLSRMVPVRLVMMAYVPLFLTSLLSNNWLGLTLKILSILWALIPIKAAFSSMWEKYEFLGAFVTLNTIWFAILVFANGPGWLNFVLGFLIVIGFGTMFKHIGRINKR